MGMVGLYARPQTRERPGKTGPMSEKLQIEETVIIVPQTSCYRLLVRFELVGLLLYPDIWYSGYPRCSKYRAALCRSRYETTVTPKPMEGIENLSSEAVTSW